MKSMFKDSCSFAVAVAVLLSVFNAVCGCGLNQKNLKTATKTAIAAIPQRENRKAIFSVTLRFCLRFAVAVAVAVRLRSDFSTAYRGMVQTHTHTHSDT